MLTTLGNAKQALTNDRIMIQSPSVAKELEEIPQCQTRYQPDESEWHLIPATTTTTKEQNAPFYYLKTITTINTERERERME